MPKALKTKEKKEAKSGKTMRRLSHILLRPRITEKASDFAMNKGVYVFEVPMSATKHEVTLAVIDFYKVTPVKIAMVRIPRKNLIVRGRKGKTAEGKKAYVYLKKGDKIEFV